MSRLPSEQDELHRQVEVIHACLAHHERLSQIALLLVLLLGTGLLVLVVMHIWDTP
jgi:sensor domain CHASE-containing protein